MKFVAKRVIPGLSNSRLLVASCIKLRAHWWLYIKFVKFCAFWTTSFISSVLPLSSNSVDSAETRLTQPKNRKIRPSQALFIRVLLRNSHRRETRVKLGPVQSDTELTRPSCLGIGRFSEPWIYILQFYFNMFNCVCGLAFQRTNIPSQSLYWNLHFSTWERSEIN